jgi:hypothetical protein
VAFSNIRKYKKSTCMTCVQASCVNSSPQTDFRSDRAIALLKPEALQAKRDFDCSDISLSFYVARYSCDVTEQSRPLTETPECLPDIHEGPPNLAESNEIALGCLVSGACDESSRSPGCRRLRPATFCISRGLRETVFAVTIKRKS